MHQELFGALYLVQNFRKLTEKQSSEVFSRSSQEKFSGEVFRRSFQEKEYKYCTQLYYYKYSGVVDPMAWLLDK
jgi:hypothetical protein